MKNEKDNAVEGADAGVDRSRLKLLGVLAAAGATGACASSPDDPLGGLKTGLTRSETFDPSKKEDEYKRVKPKTEPMGGEGGGGDGGSH